MIHFVLSQRILYLNSIQIVNENTNQITQLLLLKFLKTNDLSLNLELEIPFRITQIVEAHYDLNRKVYFLVEYTLYILRPCLRNNTAQTRELDILRRESARNGKITETYMTGLRVMKMIAMKLSFVAHNNKPNGMDWNKASSSYAHGNNSNN